MDKTGNLDLVLVGTYKEKQLAWIREHGIYNYPVKEGDELTNETCSKIKELWLYADVKSTRHSFEAAFINKMTREDFLAQNPTYPRTGKSKNESYYVFRATPIDYAPLSEDRLLVVRAVDFGGRSAKIKKAVEQFKTDGTFSSLSSFLPPDFAEISHQQLRVCEEAVQLDFFPTLEIEYMRAKALIAKEIKRKVEAEEHKLTCVEICAGAGGQAIGLERAGFVHVALVEYENEYCDVLRSNNPEWNVICADVRNFDGHPYEGVDLLAAGIPCPPFSVASKQLGEADERDLFPEALRLIDEIKPKAVMIENVRGLLDSKFDKYRSLILRKIDNLGYDVQIKLLHASDFGVPQIRPRVIIVGIKKSLNKKFIYPVTNGIHAPTVGEALEALMGANGWRGLEDWKRHANGIAPTIVGGSKKHGGPDLGPTRSRRAWATLAVDGSGIANDAPAPDFVGHPKLTKEMVAIIQGFPPDWKFGKKKTAACRMIGNAFPPPVAMAVGKHIIKCLTDEK